MVLQQSIFPYCTYVTRVSRGEIKGTIFSFRLEIPTIICKKEENNAWKEGHTSLILVELDYDGAD